MSPRSGGMSANAWYANYKLTETITNKAERTQSLGNNPRPLHLRSLSLSVLGCIALHRPSPKNRLCTINR